VPAQSARLFLPDRLFTHFEKEEDIATLRGKLEDELVRVSDILEYASRDSIVILNETFTSTTLGDAIYLGTEVLKQIIELGSLASMRDLRRRARLSRRGDREHARNCRPGRPGEADVQDRAKTC